MSFSRVILAKMYKIVFKGPISRYGQIQYVVYPNYAATSNKQQVALQLTKRTTDI